MFSFISFPTLVVRMGSGNRTAMTAHNVVMPATHHPQFNPTTRAFDIAVIRLITAIVPRADVSPIALPPLVNPPLILPHEFEEGQFAGFGFQSIRDQSPSQFLYRGFQRVGGNIRCGAFFFLEQDRAFCAEDTVERSSPCNGDVGDPFILSYRRQDVLVGIISMHPPCGFASPTAYTRITFFRQWLQEQLMV